MVLKALLEHQLQWLLFLLLLLLSVLLLLLLLTVTPFTIKSVYTKTKKNLTVQKNTRKADCKYGM